MPSVQEFKVRDIISELHDGPHATPPSSETGPVFLGIKNVGEDGALDLTEIRRISDDDFAQWTRRTELRQDDVVLTYEASLHRYALIPPGFRGCLGRRLAVIRPRPDIVSPQFLLYYFLSPEWRATVTSRINIGSTVDRLPLSQLPDFPLRLPSRQDQDGIAEVLSAYDDLIENNARRIKILEEMAQSIYREWFVNFRYPGHESVPLVDSPLGPIPEGWRTGSLRDIADVNREKVRASDELGDIQYVDIASVQTNDLGSPRCMEFAKAPGRARRRVRHGDTIWSTVRPNRRAVALVLHPDPNVIVSTGFAVLSPRSVPYSYLFRLVTTDAFVDYLVGRATGAAYPAVTARVFEIARIPVPPAELVASFGRIAEPLEGCRETLRRANANLRATRDLLLPRLISGEVSL